MCVCGWKPSYEYDPVLIEDVICREGGSPGVSLSFPKSLEELRTLSARLHALKDDHFYSVLGLFSAAYLYKQTFAIPGSVFMVRL